MIKVGVTGGIGSGKSIVCKVFSVLGASVYNADSEAKKLSDSHPEIRKQLIDLAGKEVYNGAVLNRPFLANLIFNNKELLMKVNRIIHPVVADHFNKWCHLRANVPYIIHESAILFESRLNEKMEKIIAVAAPSELRIRRVLSRKGMDLQRIEAIMKNQLPEKVITGMADYILINDDVTPVIPQVLKLHNIFLNLQTINEFKG